MGKNCSRITFVKLKIVSEKCFVVVVVVVVLFFFLFPRFLFVCLFVVFFVFKKKYY